MELLILCMTIFVVRIMDVTLGTVRTINMVKGRGLIAAGIGFVEALIWFLVVRDALNSDINSIWIAIAFAGGFAIGNYIGIKIANKFIDSVLNIQIIIEKEQKQLVNILREAGYAVSVLDAKGFEYSDKLLLYVTISNKELAKIKALISEFDETAFVIANETKFVHNGYFRQIVK